MIVSNGSKFNRQKKKPQKAKKAQNTPPWARATKLEPNIQLVPKVNELGCGKPSPTSNEHGPKQKS